MLLVTDPEIDRSIPTLSVRQDEVGHWLVQESGGRLEGRFISFAAAMGFARAELHACPGATIIIETRPLVPIIPFAPVEAWERAMRHAA